MRHNRDRLGEQLGYAPHVADVQITTQLRPVVVGLEEAVADDPGLAGSKAAALAHAASRGLPVLPGFVITTAATPSEMVGPEVRSAWETLSDHGARALAVRSSSTAEDGDASSMAGRYESVLDVVGWEDFVAAVGAVADSQMAAAEGAVGVTGDEPLAVLVQPMLDARGGGVMFGVDPVTGRSDLVVVSASADGADAVVSGRAPGSRYVLQRDGGVVEIEPSEDGLELRRRERRALVDLAREVAEVFGGPQDVEWALRGRELVLLQSRPVTTDIIGAPVGPVFSRGPVAETFPDALSPLEEDLWVPPLREAVAQSLLLSGASTRDRIADAELVTCVRGYVALDIEASGSSLTAPSVAQRFDPRRRLSRLMSAWRIGRLRAALPGLATDVLERCDGQLSAVPVLPELSDRQLVAALDRCGRALVALHAHEVLMGQLVDPGAPRLTGASVALRVLAHARASGTREADIPRHHPVVLTLTPPRIANHPRLPADVEAPTWSTEKDRDRDAVLREALRIRVRWVQELMGRACWELGVRLTERGQAERPDAVRALRLTELRAAVLDGAPVAPAAPRDERPVPVRFRLTPEGEPVAMTSPSSGDGATGAGGGRGSGPVVHELSEVEPGCVLVVPTLDASLAPALPKLSALVSETGSVLAHIAILAREAGVPTVVGAVGAVDRYPVGASVVVNGTTGDVERRKGGR